MNDEQDPFDYETDGQPELPQIGEALRAAREARGESVAEVAAALKFSTRQILAMEGERVHELPGPAFVKGFYRNYGRYLGVDIEPMIAARWSEPSARSVELSPVTNARGTLPGSGRRGGVGRAIAALVSVLVVVLALGWYFDGFRLENRPSDVPDADLADASDGETEPLSEVEIIEDEPLPVETADPVEEVSPVASGVQARPSPAIIEAPPAPALARAAGDAQSELAQTADPSAAPTPAPPADVAAPLEQVDAQSEPAEPQEPSAAASGPTSAPPAAEPPAAEPQANAAAAREQAVGSGSSRLVFSLSSDAWLQVKDAQDRTLYVGTSRGGTTRVVQGDPPFWVTIGNADAVSLEFDGAPVELAPHMHTAGVARLVLE